MHGPVNMINEDENGDDYVTSPSVLGKSWRLSDTSIDDVNVYARTMDLNPVVLQIARTRNVNPIDFEDFFYPTFRKSLPDPRSLHGMERAAHYLADWICNGKVIGLLGDYDVDGATSTAMLGRYLKYLDVEHKFYIPDRFTDGYGPSEGAWDFFQRSDIRHIVTMDCGATAFAALQDAYNRDLKIVVIDHHKMGESDPICEAIVNPNHPEDKSNCGQLCAAGVVFMVLVRLQRILINRGFFSKKQPPDLKQFSWLVAMGAVCDVVPLVGINRLLVKFGLHILLQSPPVPVQALLKVANRQAVQNAEDLGFIIGPRLNAGGRLGKSSWATKLLLCDNIEEALLFAQKLDDLNKTRRKIESDMLEKALELVEKMNKIKRTFVLADPSFHEGVMGIVAGRIKEKFQKPTAICAPTADGWKGSARSVQGFDIGRVVMQAVQKGILTSGGGHSMAAGFSVAHQNLHEFECFFEQSAEHMPKAVCDELFIDAKIDLGRISLEFMKQLNDLGPFGMGNQKPVFLLQKVRLVYVQWLKEKHVKVSLENLGGGSKAQAICFYAKDTKLESFFNNSIGEYIDLAVHLQENHWNGRSSADIHVVDAMQRRTALA